MPNPVNFDSQSSFMSACVSEVKAEGKTHEQAVGKCLGMWANKSFDKSIENFQKGINIMKKEFRCDIQKFDDELGIAFGWFSIARVGDEIVEDSDEHRIQPSELEKAAYQFTLQSRQAGENHIKKGVGELIETIAFTKEKQELIVKSLKEIGVENPVCDLGVDGWWGGFYIPPEHSDIRKALREGEYVSFSIGGEATANEIGE